MGLDLLLGLPELVKDWPDDDNSNEGYNRLHAENLAKICDHPETIVSFS